MTSTPPSGKRGSSQPTPPPPDKSRRVDNQQPAEDPTDVDEPSPVRPPDEPTPD